uniref:Uncharacterized protein n=1 Tax=Glossina austeni TaxID=7395 RepID=A0A1A9V5Q4_GLOAU
MYSCALAGQDKNGVKALGPKCGAILFLLLCDCTLKLGALYFSIYSKTTVSSTYYLQKDNMSL